MSKLIPEFEARGYHVLQKPLGSTGDRSVRMGFRVLSVNKYIADGAAVAATIAKIMNQHAKEFTE